MDMEMMAKMQALENIPAFEEELAMANDVQQLREVFAKYGVDMTAEELDQLLTAACSQANGELSAEDLDGVAGGIWYVVAGKFVVKAVAGWVIKKGLDHIYNRFFG